MGCVEAFFRSAAVAAGVDRGIARNEKPAEVGALGYNYFRIGMISVWIGCPVTSMSLSET
jgi:hypothetical protein